MKDIISVLKKIDKEINKEIRYLNNGGCGFAAYYIAEQLLEKQIPFEFICSTSKDADNMDWSCIGHIWVKVDNYHVNQDDCPIGTELSGNNLLFDDLGEALEDEYIWNTRFDRNQCDHLKQIIVENFQKLKKND